MLWRVAKVVVLASAAFGGGVGAWAGLQHRSGSPVRDALRGLLLAVPSTFAGLCVGGAIVGWAHLVAHLTGPGRPAAGGQEADYDDPPRSPDPP